MSPTTSRNATSTTKSKSVLIKATPRANTKPEKTAAKKLSASSKSASQDAIAVLRADHQTVSALFDAYEKTNSDDRKELFVRDICRELTVHAQIEEEIFYPAVRVALNDEELVPEALVEHSTLKDLISQLKKITPEDDLYDAKVKVLSEYVKHHVAEEQDEMFPKVKRSSLDLKTLGDDLAERKEQLLAQYDATGGNGIIGAITGQISRVLS